MSMSKLVCKIMCKKRNLMHDSCTPFCSRNVHNALLTYIQARCLRLDSGIDLSPGMWQSVRKQFTEAYRKPDGTSQVTLSQGGKKIEIGINAKQIVSQPTDNMAAKWKSMCLQSPPNTHSLCSP